MKTLLETADYSEALVIKSVLEQAGFLVHLDNFHVSTAMPHLTSGLGLRLVVADQDYEPALAVLREARAGNASVMADEDSIDECPTCGSDNVVRFHSIFWVPVLWVMGLVYPVPGGNMRRCQNCYTIYKTEGPAVARRLKKFLFLWFLLFLTIFAYEAYYFWQEGARLEYYCPPGWFCD